jgi:hypothetical protein
MPTLRILVSDDLHHQLIELKGKMKADDWPALMQCIVNESRWADFARPLVNTLLKWTETDPVQEPEALRKLGFAVLDLDGKGSKGIMYPGLEVLVCPETASLTHPESVRPLRPADTGARAIVYGAKCARCGHEYLLQGEAREPCPMCNQPHKTSEKDIILLKKAGLVNGLLHTEICGRITLVDYGEYNGKYAELHDDESRNLLRDAWELFNGKKVKIEITEVVYR